MDLELPFMSLTPEAIVACLWLSLQNVSCMFNRFWSSSSKPSSTIAWKAGSYSSA
jgi:hypothetical protein